MSILYNKVGSLYVKTRNANKVTSYTLSSTIDCKIEPVQDVSDTSFDGISAFEVYQIFSDNTDIKASDKITIDSIDYVVKGVKRYDGKLRKYSISYAVKGQGS